jgi:hypothetical protein
VKIAAALAAAASCLLTAPYAAAEPGLGSKVYDPYVRSGVTEVEVRTGRLTGGASDGDTTSVVELEKGLNDTVSLAVLGEFEKHPGEKAKLDSLGVEGVLYLGQVPALGIDTAVYLEYEQRLQNESGVGEAKLLFGKTVGRFQALLNLVAERPFSNRPGEGVTTFGYATSATWKVAPGLRAGVEGFGDLGTDRRLGGRNAHYVGPTLLWETRPAWMRGGELELQAGYLFAAGAAGAYAAGQAQFNLEFERRF